MAFVSDNTSFRTYDPDTGWELKPDNHGMRGQFTLVHPKKPSLEFLGRSEILCRLPELDVPGKGPAYRVIFHLERFDWDHPSKASPEQIQLVHEALLAYGFVHDGPLPGTLEIAVPPLEPAPEPDWEFEKVIEEGRRLDFLMSHARLGKLRFVGEIPEPDRIGVWSGPKRLPSHLKVFRLKAVNGGSPQAATDDQLRLIDLFVYAYCLHRFGIASKLRIVAE